jgi:GT2 family glycosyltransferase
MDVNVVILNWNARADTLECLDNLSRWTRLEARACVVDNGSATNDSVAFRHAFPNALVLRSDENLGFSGGTNLGLRRVLEDSDAPVLLLNNDVHLREEAVEALLATLAADRRCAIAGPLVYSAGEPARILSAGNRSPVLHRDHSLTTPPPGRVVYPVQFVTGAAALIRAAVLREVGLLCEQYFFGLELADLCRRIRDRGYRCLVTTNSRVEHDIRRSSALRDTLYVYYAVRNRMLYARRFLRFRWPILLALWAAYGLQQAARLWLKERRGTATAIFLGVRDGLRGRFGNQNESVLRLCAVPLGAAGAQR